MSDVEETWGSMRRYGARTVQDTDVSAGSVTILTGLNAIAMQVVQIVRAGKIVTADAGLSLAGADISVGSGSSYALTAGDQINWLVAGA